MIARVNARTSTFGRNVQAEVNSAVVDIIARLESVESRFPDDANIDKISSINDALFAERIEQLSARLATLEQNQLTKWDVAITVSVVLGGIGAVVGATYGVLIALGILVQ